MSQIERIAGDTANMTVTWRHKAAAFLMSVLFIVALNAVCSLLGYNESPYRIRTRMFIKDPVYGFRLNPEGDRFSFINRQGLKEDHIVPSVRPEEEKLRILALGDSIFFAYFGVSGKQKGICEELEIMLSERIKQDYRNDDYYCEVINASSPCRGFSYYNLFYDMEMHAFDPDFFLVGICANDLMDDFNFHQASAGADTTERQIYLEGITGKSITDADNLRRGLKDAYAWLVSRVPLLTFFQKKVFDSHRKIKRDQRQKILESLTFDDISLPFEEEFKALLDKTGGKVLYILYPSQEFVDGSADRFFPYEREFRVLVKGILKEKNTRYIDVYEIYQDFLNKNPEYDSEYLYAGPGDIVHPSVEAHRLSAEAAYHFLTENGWMNSLQ